MVFLFEPKHRIMVTYKMLFNSSLTNLKEITIQRNKSVAVNQSDQVTELYLIRSVEVKLTKTAMNRKLRRHRKVDHP
jgi:hypothetical protein